MQIKTGLQTNVGLYLGRCLTYGFDAMCADNYPSMGHVVFAHLFSKWRRGLAGCRQFYNLCGSDITALQVGVAVWWLVSKSIR